MAGQLAGKVAIVTGAGSGMGVAIAKALASEGARVALAGRRSDLLEATAKSAKGDTLVQRTDMSRWPEVESLVAAVIARWGRVDIMVNNAGTNTKRRSYADATIEDYDVVVRTNLDGVYFGTRAVLPQMREQGGGLIVNIASMAGRRAGVVSGVAYSASKHGVIALTQSVNAEEWQHNIRASCVEPGEVATPILDLRPEPPPKDTWADMVQAQDIGEAVRWLCTLPDRVLVDEMTIRPRVQRSP